MRIRKRTRKRAKRDAITSLNTHAAKRLKLTLSVLKNAPRWLLRKAAAEAGLDPAKGAKRVRNHLELYQQFGDAPREREPCVYSDEVLDKAISILSKERGLTCEDLKAKLIADGTLSAKGHSTQHFTRKLKERVEACLGQHMYGNYRECVSYLSQSDCDERVKWCKSLLETLETGQRKEEDLVVWDVTSEQESPHPKCECYTLHHEQCRRATVLHILL
jgi:hypothetical protein